MTRQLFAIAVAFLALCACSTMPAYDPLEVTVAGIEPMQEKGEGLEVRLLVKLRVQNPNSGPVDYDGAYVKVEVQDRKYATGVSNAGGSIPGFGETVVEVPVTVSMFRVVRNVLAMSGDAPAEQLRYEMSGKIGRHRFSAAGEFSLKPPAPPAAGTTI
jgi:LEA14-like dessication related protein